MIQRVIKVMNVASVGRRETVAAGGADRKKKIRPRKN